MSNKSKIEICANSVESAVKAQQAGAYRVELCAGIPEGGTTPSFGEIRMARQLLNQTKLHVIIRPRGGDFLYSPIEQEIMLHDIKVARQLGADGRLSYRRRLCRCASDAETDECGRRDECHLPPCF